MKAVSVVFPADRQIAGYKPTVLKKALLAYSRTENSTNLLGLKMFPEKRDAAIMYEEWLDRGLIGADGNLTDKGKAIAAGKARKRVSCAEAQAILDDFLNRVDAVNRDRDHIVNVQQVWLYGSMLKEGVTAVADIDLAVLSSRRDEYHATLNAKDGGAKAKEQLRKLLARHPDHPSTGSFSTSMCPWWFGAEVWLVRRALYGGGIRSSRFTKEQVRTSLPPPPPLANYSMTGAAAVWSMIPCFRIIPPRMEHPLKRCEPTTPISPI